MTDDRDTPRPGRPPDIPSESSDPTEDLTPPPQPLPILTQRSIERAKAATRDPGVSDSVRASLGETFRQVEILRAGVTEAIDSLRALHPVRKAPDQLLGLEQRIVRVEQRPDEMADDIDDLKAAVIDIGGRSGNNGKLGALYDRVERGEDKLDKHIASTTTDLGDLKAWRWKVAGATAVVGIFTGLITAILTVLITRNL